MMMTSQPDLIPPTPETDASQLRQFLSVEKQWRPRAEIVTALGWTERRVRAAAEQLGAEVFPSQAGFKLTKYLTRDDLPLAQQSVDSFLSQGKHMIRCALARRRKLHAIIG